MNDTAENVEGGMLLPDGWARPRGYSHGLVRSGKYVTLAGQIGWNPESCQFETDDFAGQTAQALRNIVTLLGEAGAVPSDLVRLTWFVVDRDDYNGARRSIGESYREIIGDHYPSMSVVIVKGLLEQRARVEIEATAVIPDRR